MTETYRGLEIHYRNGAFSTVDAYVTFNGKRIWSLDSAATSKGDARRKIQNRIDWHLRDEGK